MEYKPFTKKTCKVDKKIESKECRFYSIIFNSNVVGTYLITFGEQKSICVILVMD